MNTTQLLLVGLDLLVKSTMIVALAGACTAVLRRRSAAARHAVWFAAIGALLVLPLTKFARPRWAWQPRAVTAKTAVMARAVAPRAATAPVLTPRPASAPAAGAWKWPQWQTLLGAAWGAGAALVSGHQVLGLALLRRARRQGCEVNDARLAASHRRVAAEFGIGGKVELRLSKSVRVPATWGAWRRVLMLPRAAAQWEDARLEAALRHEFAHIARRDYLTRTVARFACALYWPNPLVWAAARALRREQEHACDDLVLNAGTAAETYATLLLEAARLLRGAPLLPAGAVAMARPSTLEGRVLAIVDEARDRRPAGGLTHWLAAAGAALSMALCGAAQVLAAESHATGAGTDKAIEIETRIVEILPEVSARKENAEWLPASGHAPVILPAGRYENVIATLSAQKGVDVLSVPRITTRPGQHASISAGDEAAYGGEWVKGPNGWEAKNREHRHVGVKIEITPTLAADGKTILLDLDSTATALLGYLDLDSQKVYDSPARAAGVKALDGASAKAPAGVRAEPLFSSRSVVAKVSLAPGEGAVASRLMRLEGAEPAAPESDAARFQLVVFVRARVVDGPAAEVSTRQVSPAMEQAAKIIIPRLEFRDATVRESVDFLRQKSAALDPEHKGVNFVLNAPSGALPRITLSLTNIPLSEAARYVAKLAGLSTTAVRDAIVFEAVGLSREGAGDLPPTKNQDGRTAATRTPSAKPEEENPIYKKAQGLIIPKLEFRDVPLRDAIDFLRQKTVTLDSEHKGINLVLVPPPGEAPRITISLSSVPVTEAVLYVAKLAGLGMSVDANGIVIGPETSNPATKAGTESAAAKKAQALILPKVEFREATLREAVEFLRAKSRTLDPQMQGVNIVIAPGVDEGFKITLSLIDASLWEALGYVAKLAKVEMGGEENALVLQAGQ